LSPSCAARYDARGVGDILIAVVDGLEGFPEAINAVFPETIIQTCVVHGIFSPQGPVNRSISL
jgi:transposase-like protein